MVYCCYSLIHIVAVSSHCGIDMCVFHIVGRRIVKGVIKYKIPTVIKAVPRSIILQHRSLSGKHGQCDVIDETSNKQLMNPFCSNADIQSFTKVLTVYHTHAPTHAHTHTHKVWTTPYRGPRTDQCLSNSSRRSV